MDHYETHQIADSLYEIGGLEIVYALGENVSTLRRLVPNLTRKEAALELMQAGVDLGRQLKIMEEARVSLEERVEQ